MTPIPASQCALHSATLAVQWWAERMLIPTVRRAWREARSAVASTRASLVTARGRRTGRQTRR